MYKILLTIGGIAACLAAEAQQMLPYNYIRTWEPSMRLNDPVVVMDPARPVEDVRQQTEYIDGMGRVIQTVGKGISPLVNGAGKLDVVTPAVYNDAGQQEFKYLPYVAATADGAFKNDALTQQNAFMTAQYPAETAFYERTEYEKSPVHRILKSMPAGQSWAGSNRGVTNQYLVNTTTDEVRIWTIGSTITALPVSSAAYTAGTLFKNFVTDEQGKRTVEFRNIKDQVVLRKKELTSNVDGHNGWLCTYFVYDDLNQLRFVIPPAAVEVIATDWTFANRQQLADDLCYRYFYDDRNRLVVKKIPGKAEEEMVYDPRDRLVFTRHGNLVDAKKWLVTFYDEYNRAVMTALYSSEATRVELQQSMNQATGSRTITNTIADMGEYDLVVPKRESGIAQYQARNSITFTDGFETLENDQMVTVLGATVGNTTVNVTVTNPLPNISEAALTPLTYTYFDNYSWPGSKPYSSYEADLQTGGNLHPEPVGKSNNTIGLNTGSKIKVLIPGGGEQWLTSTIYYDDKGKVVQILSDHIAGGTDISSTRYNFNGKAISTFLHHRNPHCGTTPETKLLTIMEYDYGGRLLAVQKKLNANAVKTIVQNKYEKTGRLSSKVLGPGLQELTYEYNPRGWLIGMNRGYLTGEAKPYRFGYELAYDKNTSVIPGSSYLVPQFNGNVAGTTWRSIGDGAKRKYDYSYDPSNRLLKASFLQQQGTAWNTIAADFTVTMGNGTDPISAYDANGNIKRMQQRGLKAGSPSSIDDLNYKYVTNSNKLKYVRDAFNDESSSLGDFKEPAANNAANLNSELPDYEYDKNGNIKNDLNKRISSITYNIFNMPEKVVVDGKGTIEYYYDAKGNKLRKIVRDISTSPIKTSVTDYINGLVYENDKLLFIPHEEGRIRLVYKTGQQPTYEYDYFVKDYLSNVRLVLSEQLDYSMYTATMESERAATETALFSNVDETRAAKPVGYPQADDAGKNKFVAKLNAKAGGQKIGPSLVLKVMAGDTVQINARAFYKSQEPVNNKKAPLAEDMVANLLQAFRGVPEEHAHGAPVPGQSSPFTSNFYGNDYQRLKQRDADAVKQNRLNAYLNFVLFDEQFKFVEVNSGVRQVKKAPDQLQTLSVDKMPISKNGFLYIYTSNESEQDVFFDDVTILGITGPVIEETHYYPFGLVMPGISSNALKGLNYPENKNKFTSQWLDDELSWNTYQMKWRTMDPQIGRFMQIDPLATDYVANAPYAYAENRVTTGVDLEGLEWTIRVDANQVTQINANVNFSVDQGLNLSPATIKAYQSAINGVLDYTFNLSSNGQVRGGVTFDKITSDQAGQVVPTLALYGNPGSVIGGQTSFNMSSVNVYNRDGTLKSPQQLALDAVHEMLHTLRLDHPFEKTQAADARLVGQAGKQNSFSTTQSTDPSIFYNIMNYSMLSIDGQKLGDLWKYKSATYLTPGQMSQVISEIGLQQRGAGMYGSDYFNYWLNTPGSTVIKLPTSVIGRTLQTPVFTSPILK